MNPIIGTLLLCVAVCELIRVMRDWTENIKEYAHRYKRIRRLRRTIQTDTFLRDTAGNETVREYYAEQVRLLTEKLKSIA